MAYQASYDAIPVKLVEPFLKEPTNSDSFINELQEYPIHPIVSADEKADTINSGFLTYPGPSVSVLKQPYYRSKSKPLRLPKVIRFLNFVVSDSYNDGLHRFADPTNQQIVANVMYGLATLLQGNSREAIVSSTPVGGTLNNVLPSWAYTLDGQLIIQTRDWIGGDVLDLWIANDLSSDSGFHPDVDYYISRETEFEFAFTVPGSPITDSNWTHRLAFIENELEKCRNHHLVLFLIEQHQAVSEKTGLGNVPEVIAWDSIRPTSEYVTATGINNESMNTGFNVFADELMTLSKRGWEFRTGIPDASSLFAIAKTFFNL